MFSNLALCDCLCVYKGLEGGWVLCVYVIRKLFVIKNVRNYSVV